MHTEIREVEDLVLQISFFAHHCENPRYTAKIIKNLAKKTLSFLRIDHSHLKHLLKHEKKTDRVDLFTVKKRSTKLHDSLGDKKRKITSSIESILVLCKKINEDDIGKKYFLEGVNRNCSICLKIIKSEHHDLKLIKDMHAHQTSVIARRKMGAYDRFRYAIKDLFTG